MRHIGLGLLLLVVSTGAAAQDAAHREEFAKRDGNRDGRLTAEEYGGHPGNFRNMDCDKNGTLSEREFVNRYDCKDTQPAPGRTADRFQGLDGNNDGVLSRSEWRHETVAFHRADRNADGVVTRSEYGNLPAPTPEEVRFERADKDGDGVLDRREWAGSEQFERMDRNRDGIVTLNEYLNPPPAAIRDAFFEEMDHNEDGLLSRWEWHGEPAGFENRDRNDDGYITASEFTHPEPGASSSDVRFRQLDRDGDGSIGHAEWDGDWESFLVLDQNRDGAVGLYEYLRTRPLDRRFALLDHDRNGSLSREEWHGEPSLFDKLDRDRNGRLGRDEFPH
jgi:Ca2+-binding EF-hand superfamily protein